MIDSLSRFLLAGPDWKPSEGQVESLAWDDTRAKVRCQHMGMLKEERQLRILEMLRVEGKLVATDLSEALGVSEDTVRRDLRELAEAGSSSGSTAARSRARR